MKGMTMAVTAGATPIAEQDRLIGLDVARGFALFGILLINSTGMGLYEEAGFNFRADGGEGGLNIAAWAFGVAYVEGTMRALFSLLFGAGLVLFLGRLEEKGTTNAGDIHGRRMLWLAFFGIVNTIVLMYPYDILLAYAVAGLLFFPFRKLAARWLLLISLLLMGSIMAVGFVDLQGYEEEVASSDAFSLQEDAAALLDEDASDLVSELEDLQAVWEGADGYKEAEADQRRERGVLTHMSRSAEELAAFVASEDFWFDLLDVLLMMFIGMALIQSGVLRGTSSAGVYWALLIVGYGVGLALGIWRTWDLWRSDFDLFSLDLHWALYEPRRLFLALGHVGMIYLFVQAGALRGLQNVLAAVGRMAFTNYLMQSLLQVLIWYGPGLGLTQQLERYQVFLVVFAIWVFQGVFSVLWLKAFRFGPLEWVWRALTYVSLPPIRKSAL